MFYNYILNLGNLYTSKAATILQSYRFEPKFCDFIISFDVDMWRLISIGGIKKKSIWANS